MGWGLHCSGQIVRYFVGPPSTRIYQQAGGGRRGAVTFRSSCLANSFLGDSFKDGGKSWLTSRDQSRCRRSGLLFIYELEKEISVVALDEGRAARLAGWIRNLDLADQVFITGTTLVLEDIRTRRKDLPLMFDEGVLRESEPGTAYRLALELAEGYASLPPAPGPDGVDENWRISNMTRELADRIATHHPEVQEGGR